MTPPFSVNATPHYDRLARRLARQHPEFDGMEESARDILQTDPYNRSRRYDILKLEGIAQGEGQWRLSLGRLRFRYDIFGRQVWLFRCSLRREDTYR
jgi:hypothetical protein